MRRRRKKRHIYRQYLGIGKKNYGRGRNLFLFLICATVKGPLPIVLYCTCVCNIMKGEEGGKKDARFLYLLKFVWELWGTTGGAMQLLLLLYSTWTGLYSIAHLSVARRRRRFFSFFLFGIIQMLH